MYELQCPYPCCAPAQFLMPSGDLVLLPGGHRAPVCPPSSAHDAPSPGIRHFPGGGWCVRRPCALSGPDSANHAGRDRVASGGPAVA